MKMANGIVAGSTALLLALSTGMAFADSPGAQGVSIKDEAPAADTGRKFTYSFNFGVTSDYVFRGISQNAGQPTPQGGVDFGYGIGYAGVWASGIDFGQNIGTPGAGIPGIDSVANHEIDLYAGIKPVYGPLTFDLGAIYYWYPDEHAHGPRFGQARDNNYVEGKIGVSGTPMTNWTTGVTLFVSPNYTGGQGVTEVVEGTSAYELPHLGKVVPTLSDTIGFVFGDARDSGHPFVAANGRSDYMYYNTGITFALDKLSLDLRYWDTNIRDRAPGGAPGFCTGNNPGTSGGVFQCDSRFVGTVKVTF